MAAGALFLAAHMFMLPSEFAQAQPPAPMVVVAPDRLPPNGLRTDDDGQQRARLGVTLGDNSQGKVWIRAVEPHSAAEMAGLQPNDQLTALNDQPITTNSDVIRYVNQEDASDDIEVRLIRNGKPGVLTVSRFVRHESRNLGTTFLQGSCTYYAAVEFERANRVKVDWNGHARSWLENASLMAWETSTNPWRAEKGAILVWSGGQFGHVAIVREVLDDRVIIEEMNAGRVMVDVERGTTDDFNIVRKRYLNMSNRFRRGGLTFVGFILPRPQRQEGTRPDSCRFVPRQPDDERFTILPEQSARPQTWKDAWL